MSTERDLLILALSGRALAQSAARDGWRATVVDGFADQDTQRAAACCHRVAIEDQGLSTAGLAAAVSQTLRRIPRCSVIYGAGLEASVAVIQHCQQQAELLGNDAATVTAVHDPDSFFGLLDTLGLPCPPFSRCPPASGDWLLKYVQGCGGSHIAPWRRGMRAPAGAYWQRRVPGQAGSALFLADGQRAKVLGWNTLWRRSQDYVFGGAINRLRLPLDQRDHIERAVSCLARELSLVGLNSLDFVLTRDEPQILELNPRPSATMELYDADYRQGLVTLHARACRGTLNIDDVTPAGRGMVRANCIVYARSTVAVPDGIGDWPRWCSDIPDQGQTIVRGVPLCTVHAAGDDAVRVTALARARQEAVLRWMRRPLSTRAVA